VLVSPGGSVARYLYGLEFSPRDLQLGLLEASDAGRIGPFEQFNRYLYRYEPRGRTYVLYTERILAIAGAVAAPLLAAGLALGWRQSRRKPSPGGMASAS